MSKVALGLVVATPGIVDFVGNDLSRNTTFRNSLIRHANGDWGLVDSEDKTANDIALLSGSRLLSAYEIESRKIWIITEADRSSTTVLFPEEY